MSEGGALPEDVSTLAERLRDAGYQTAGFAAPSRPFAGSGLTRGFDFFVEDHAEIVFRDGVPVDGLLMRAFDYLRTEFDPQRPQFLWLHFGSPAPPWDAEPYPTATGLEEFQTRYIDPEYAGPVETNLVFLEKVNRGEVALDAADQEALIALYDGDLERANFLLRQLLEIYKHHFQKEDAVWERTLVVTAGLSGCELGERGYFGSKQSLHEQGLHVPLAFHHPASLTGRRILEDLVGLSDVMPTVCEWMGVESPDGLEGRSLLDGMDRGRSLTPRPVVAELPGGLLSARVGELRVLLNREGLEREDSYSVGAVELYDLVGDPAELEECSGGRVGELEGVLRAISEWEARFPPLD
jgi:arylsulfatase A-like enzyme